MLEQLGINWQGLIGQIINFAILLGLLYFIGYKPIMKMFDERSRRIKEAGLGLYICRQILNAHGGNIWVESGAGRGSIFSFALKVRDAAN